MKLSLLFISLLLSMPAFAGILEERVEYNVIIPVKALINGEPELLNVQDLAAQVAVKKGWNIHIQCTKKKYCQFMSKKILNESRSAAKERHTGLSFLDGMLDKANIPTVTTEVNAKINSIKLIGKSL